MLPKLRQHFFIFYNLGFSSLFMSTSMVVKHAAPPIKLDMGSAIKTPTVPKLNILGSIIVRGITIIPLRSIEKNIACFDLPKPTNTD